MSETTETKAEEYNGELPHTVEFKYPVKVGKETTLSSLTFTEIPDAQCVATMPASENVHVGDMYPIIAAMTKTPEVHIRKVKFPDLKRCFPVVNHFLAE